MQNDPHAILVVDDDPATVSGMTALLSEDGHEVSPHTCGARAVDTLSRESFDAVVTDLEMPRVDGHAVVRAARKHQPHACLVVVTARGKHNCAELFDAGACIVEDKPLDLEALTEGISACRARASSGATGECPMRARPQGERLLPRPRK